MRRLVLFAALALLVPAAAASASVHIRAVDTATDFGRVRVTVVTSQPTSKPPTVLENGKPVQNASAVNLGSSKSVVLAIDSSQSMAGKPLSTALAAARAFADSKPTTDQIAISTFASQAGPPTPFSTSTTDSDVSLRSISIDSTSGTRMYDDLLLDVQALAAQGTPGRVVIVVTDGNETSSRHSLGDVVAAAKKAHVLLYMVGIESKLFTPATLKALASGTGGRYYAAASVGYLQQIYASIANELARTWQIEYATAARPGDHLTLTASVPGQGSAQQATVVAGSEAVQQSKPSIPKSAYSTTGTFIIAVLVGTLLMLAIRVLFRKSRSEELRRRIQPHVGKEPEKVKTVKRERLGLMRGLFSSTEHVLGRKSFWNWLTRLLERGDVPLKTVEFAYVILGSGLLLGFLFSVFGLSGIFLLVAFLLGASLPIGFVWRKAKKRLNAFDEQLPDLLMAVAASLKAGHSFKQGIQTLVEEAQDPCKKEFQRVLAEASLGRPIEAA
ncbi:MAG TPA: VWA domain-containing protein, partial [Gaiellaceae bacterium]|nr:VWA domain-containing protein [Gaiellaceae bacterium]